MCYAREIVCANCLNEKFGFVWIIHCSKRPSPSTCNLDSILYYYKYTICCKCQHENPSLQNWSAKKWSHFLLHANLPQRVRGITQRTRQCKHRKKTTVFLNIYSNVYEQETILIFFNNILYFYFSERRNERSRKTILGI